MSNPPSVLTDPSPAAANVSDKPSPWAPLAIPIFRSLYIATSIAQIGTWAREAGSPSLMMVLTHGWKNQPDMVGRITLYSNLPICLFSLFAGALADVLDRRRLLIWTNAWMIAVSVILGVLTFTGHVSPWGLLGMTFLLGVGTAMTGPALQAVLPELVPPKDMALAINLNSVALNVARAVGPAMFIIVVFFVPGVHGIALSYMLSALTFAGAIWVLWRWSRAPQRAAVHGEDLLSAVRAGFAYTIHSRANRAILFRVAAFIVPAVVLWSQVPVIAQNQLGLPKTPGSYALLFAFVGLGAIGGVLLMPGLHRRFKIDPVVNICTLLFAVGLVAMSFVHHLWLAAILLVFLGVNWVIIPTNFNTATQKSVPPWVKGRAISFYLTVLFGSFAVAGALWGKVTTATSIATSLRIGGVAMATMLLLAKRYPLTLNEGHDLSPAHKPGTPPAGPDVPPPLDPALGWTGPVDVAVEYHVAPDRAPEFLAAMHVVGQQRRRNGAAHWLLKTSRGTDSGGHTVYVETFRFHTAAEYARQTNRMTKEDAGLHAAARAFHVGEGLPSYRASPSRPGSSAPPVKSFGGWFGDRLLYGLERTLEEAERGILRLRR